MLNELLKSRHYRLKIECLILLLYILFECNGLIWLTSLHIDFDNEDNINFFADEDYLGFGISCAFGLIAAIFFWIFALRIILQYYHKEKDEKWMHRTKLYAKIATVCWLLSMITWTLSILTAQISGWLFKLALALIPAWNKSLCVGVVYSIFYEFNPAISRTQRVVRWISIVTIFLSVYVAILTIACGISWLTWTFSVLLHPCTIFIFIYASLFVYNMQWFGGAQAVIEVTIYMILLSIVLTPFYNFYFVLWDQLRPRFVFKYYMLCVPCCCGCGCHDRWLKCCVPKCCLNDPRNKISTWLIVGMSFVWIVCTVFMNNNECLAEASLIEYAFGFRGAAILVLVFSVLINIELTYAGPVKNRVDIIASANANAQPVAVSLQVAPPQTFGTNDGNEEVNDDDNEDQGDEDPNEQEVTVR